MTGAFRKIAGLGFTGYGVANLCYNFNTLAAIPTGAFALGGLIAAGIGALSLGVGLKLLLTDPAPAAAS